MNLWGHRFSQNTNKKLSRFLPSPHRAEILTIFCSYFGRNNDFINSFWNWLTFNVLPTLVPIIVSNYIYLYLLCRVDPQNMSKVKWRKGTWKENLWLALFGFQFQASYARSQNLDSVPFILHIYVKQRLSKIFCASWAWNHVCGYWK